MTYVLHHSMSFFWYCWNGGYFATLIVVIKLMIGYNLAFHRCHFKKVFVFSAICCMFFASFVMIVEFGGYIFNIVLYINMWT